MIKNIDNRTEKWLHESYQKGIDIINWYINDENKKLTPDILDETFIKWKEDSTENKAPNDWIIDGLGSLFGKYMIENIDCRWAIENHLGKHLVIITNTGTKIYPIHSVFKRVDSSDNEINFFNSIWKTLETITVTRKKLD